MKARAVITRSYAEVMLGRHPIQNSELQDGLRYLNNMMAKLKSSGVDVGYQELDSIDDDVDVHLGAILGIVKNLSAILWPQYRSEPINNLIQFSADRALKIMRAISINGVNASKYPSTMPVGSGNECPVYGDDFYTNSFDKSIYIATEK